MIGKQEWRQLEMRYRLLGSKAEGARVCLRADKLV